MHSPGLVFTPCITGKNVNKCGYKPSGFVQNQVAFNLALYSENRLLIETPQQRKNENLKKTALKAFKE